MNCDVIEATQAHVGYANTTNPETLREAFTSEEWWFLETEPGQATARHPNASRTDAEIPVITARIDTGPENTTIQFRTNDVSLNSTGESRSLLEPRIQPVLVNLQPDLGEPTELTYVGGNRCAQG